MSEPISPERLDAIWARLDEADRTVVEVTEYAEELVHEVDRLRTELDRVRGKDAASDGVRRSAIRLEKAESGWRVRWREDGRRRSLSLGSRREAEQFMRYLAEGGRW
ncbi:hypothetical protein [Streptomyces sp. AP-93]|uniref:hypothetical protein n=1 Tax=Streptomyces sp. AP-93 TaxID=2929048 RepID=UPI001FAF7F7F|nr:hypothetical protein [Streptomyces sp. AP-93]MCJ0875675.1 hypothetical protein [Streptomyces sp. AP-93]